jgi:AraC-like DNA-binding protein
MFARIVRVRAVLARLETGADWAALATELGYSDQAHLSRDLRDLAGLTPTQLVRALRMSDSSKPALGPLPILPA